MGKTKQHYRVRMGTDTPHFAVPFEEDVTAESEYLAQRKATKRHPSCDILSVHRVTGLRTLSVRVAKAIIRRTRRP